MEKYFWGGFNFAIIVIAFVAFCIWLYNDKIKPYFLKKIWNVPYVYYQPNVENCGDCAIRAFTKLFGATWEEAFDILTIGAKIRHLTPNCEAVLIDLLEENGYRALYIGGHEYTFARVIKKIGNLSGLGGKSFGMISRGHMCVGQDGKLYDSWDSRNEKCTWLIVPDSVVIKDSIIRETLK